MVVLGSKRVLVFLPVVYLHEVLAVLLLDPLAKKLAKSSGDLLLRHETLKIVFQLYLDNIEAGHLVDCDEL